MLFLAGFILIQFFSSFQLYLFFFDFKILSFLISFLSLLYFIFEFLFYKEFVDFLMPKKTSHHLIARRLPKGEIKRRIIFGGHSDSAKEFVCISKCGPRILAVLLTFYLSGAVLILLFSLFNFQNKKILLFFIPLYIIILFSISQKNLFLVQLII
jgi:hypothetical protein